MNKSIQQATILQLLEVQAHIGNQTSKWNPLTKSFLFGSRHKIHLFDLKQTSPFLKRMLYFVTQATKNHQLILFIGENPIVNLLIEKVSQSVQQFSMTKKWVCGTLTNWLKMRAYIQFLYTTSIAEIRKKFVLRTEKKIEQKIAQYLKMKNLFLGVERMLAIPNFIVLLENEKDSYPLMEARRLMLPVIRIINSGPLSGLGVVYPIFGNDSLFNALFFYVTVILQAIRQGTLQKRLTFLSLPAQTKKYQKKKSLFFKKRNKLSKLALFFKLYRNYKSIALKRSLRKYIK